MLQNDAQSILDKLIGLPLLYGLQSPDVVLFDLGFGEFTKVRKLNGEERSVAIHTIHAVCGIKIIYRKYPADTECHLGDTPAEFNAAFNKLVGHTIKHIALSGKNDLWIDLGDVWIVFVTNEDNEESWRYFSPMNKSSHLVSSDTWIQLE